MRMGVWVWWINLEMSCLGRTIYARQCLGDKPPTQFRHRWAEMNHPDHYTDSEQASQLPNTIMLSKEGWEAQTSQFLRFLCDVSESNPGLPHPERTLQPQCYGAIPTSTALCLRFWLCRRDCCCFICPGCWSWGGLAASIVFPALQ